MAPRRHALIALVLCPAACSDGGEPAADAPLPLSRSRSEPLTEADLMGIPRNEVVLRVPWSRSPVSRDPAPAAPRADPAFRRDFGWRRFRPCHLRTRERHAFPRIPNRLERGSHVGVRGGSGSRSRSNASAADPVQACDRAGGQRPLNRGPSSRLPGLPAIATARQLCDDKDHLVWRWGHPTLPPSGSWSCGRPPRLVVDLRHLDAESAPDSGSTGG